MTPIGRRVADRAAELLESSDGLVVAMPAVLAALGLAPGNLPNLRVLRANTSADLLDKGAGTVYPAVHVYCDRVENKLREKFRTFAGTATLTFEVRSTSDRVEAVEVERDFYVETVLEILQRRRGDWGGGMFHGGEYTVEYQPVRHGGKNYIAMARIKVIVNISVN
jgi:hypothetical protein